MNLRQAKCVDAVASLGSFRSAAAELGLSQPAVSQHIALLERDLGVKLAARTTRGAVLTEEGAALLPRIRALIAAEASAVEEAAVLRRRLGGLVKISSVNFSLSELLAPVVASFLAKHPEHRIEVREASTELVERRVREGFDDFGVFGVMGTQVASIPGIMWRAIGSVDLQLAVPPRHRLLKKESLERGEIAQEPLIAFHRGWAVREAFDAYFEGDSPNVVCEVLDIGAARSLVAAGAGLSLLPEPIYDKFVRGVAYRRLDPAPPFVTRVLAEPDRAERAPAAQAFLDELLMTVDGQGRQRAG